MTLHRLLAAIQATPGDELRRDADPPRIARDGGRLAQGDAGLPLKLNLRGQQRVLLAPARGARHLSRMTIVPDTLVAHRQHAARPAEGAERGGRVRNLRQVRIRQSRRLGEGPRGAVHRRGCRGARAARSPAGRSSRGRRAIPASAWRWSPMPRATRRSSSCPRRRAARRWTRCARSAPNWCWCPPRPIPIAAPFRAHLAPHRRGDAERDLGQPVRQYRQPPRAYRRHRARRSGRRWTGGSTASPARSGTGGTLAGRRAGAEGEGRERHASR